MQRRAIRDAKTPDKMKKSKAVKEDSNLSLQEKKDKIRSGLKRLTELGMVNPKNRYQDLINDVAKVSVWGMPRRRYAHSWEVVGLVPACALAVMWPVGLWKAPPHLNLLCVQLA